MRIFKPLNAEGFEFCHPVEEIDYETIHTQIDGVTKKRVWSPVSMKLVGEDEGKRLKESDSPWLGSHALIFRSSAVEKLKPLLEKYGELLPLHCPGAELVIYNPTEVIDALDKSGSDIRYFSSGKVMRIHRYVFRAEVVDGIDIFKIPNLRVSPTFVSDRFVERWKSSGLTGLEYSEIWSSK